MPHLLLVDDDDLFRESLGLNLIDEGYEVTSFANGRDVLAYLDQGGGADVMLLDWRMPNLTGLDVLRQIRAAGTSIPVIFLTVLSDDIYEEAALESGAVDFIDKSRRLPILLKRLQLIAEGGRTQRRPHPDRIQYPHPAGRKGRAGCRLPRDLRSGPRQRLHRRTRLRGVSCQCTHLHQTYPKEIPRCRPRFRPHRKLRWFWIPLDRRRVSAAVSIGHGRFRQRPRFSGSSSYWFRCSSISSSAQLTRLAKSCCCAVCAPRDARSASPCCHCWRTPILPHCRRSAAISLGMPAR